ncbi:MAG: hypothetical protein C5B52_05825 [Bacteroidetes bacterium]|nr:MAG: hypothetical protein C5B52_05825 [Bacteroidota bacterium]
MKQVLLCLSILIIVNVSARSQSISGTVNTYYQVIKVNSSNSTAILSDPTGLSTGVRVLLIQMKGVTMNSTNTASFGDITTINNAGKYELNTICGLLNDTVSFQNQLINNYDSGGSIQLVTVPQFANVTITGTLTGQKWDPVSGTGGVIIVEASGNITVSGNVNADGLGFGGGTLTNYTKPPYDCQWNVTVSDYYTQLVPPGPTPYMIIGGHKGEGISDFIVNKEYARGKQVNGGGGGNNHNTGGGGGSNYGAGGDGGQRSHETFFLCHGVNPGLGGMSLSTNGYTVANNRIFMGGGGGGGHENNFQGLPGGDGGGIVILKCDQLIGSGGTISAKGALAINPANTDPYSAGGDGGGGGGAGGTIILNMNSFSGTASATVDGARGSDAGYNDAECLGPGGGGGGGVIWVSLPSVPGSLTTSFSGGSNGVVSNTCGNAACRNISNGALSGSAGAALTSNLIPAGTTYSCSAALGFGPLSAFWGLVENKNANLFWNILNLEGVKKFIVERSVNGNEFKKVGELPVQNKNSYSFTDPLENSFSGKLLYRIRVLYIDGNYRNSKIIDLNFKGPNAFSINPNPANSNLHVRISINVAQDAELKIFDGLGRMVSSKKIQLIKGLNDIPVKISSLSNGYYYLKISGNAWQSNAPFIKAN